MVSYQRFFKNFILGLFRVGRRFYIQGEEHIDSFIEALKEGKSYIKGKP